VEEELASVAKVHHEVKFRVRLESVVKLHNEGRVDFFQNISLGCTADTSNKTYLGF
jgi:hypothetical protein